MEGAACIFTWITCGIRLKPSTRLNDFHCTMGLVDVSTMVLVMTPLWQFEVCSVLRGCHIIRQSMYFLSSSLHSSLPHQQALTWMGASGQDISFDDPCYSTSARLRRSAALGQTVSVYDSCSKIVHFTWGNTWPVRSLLRKD